MVMPVATPTAKVAVNSFTQNSVAAAASLSVRASGNRRCLVDGHE